MGSGRHPSARGGWPTPRLLAALVVVSTVSTVSAVSMVSTGRAAMADELGLVFEAPHVKFGDHYQHSTVEQRYAFHNPTDKTIRILNTVDIGGTGSVTAEPKTIPSGGRGEVLVRQPLGSRLGGASYRYAIVTDEPVSQGEARYRMTLSGFVQSAYDPEMIQLDFGTVERELGGVLETELFSREIDVLKIVETSERASYIDVTAGGRKGVANEGLVFQTTLHPEAPLGYHHGAFRIHTNVPHQPILEVIYRFNLIGDVRPAENPIQFEPTTVGDFVRKTVDFWSHNGAPVKIDRVEDSESQFSFAIEDCTGAAEGALCQRLAMSMPAERHQQVRGRLKVYVNGREQDPISLSYLGIVIEEGTRIKTIGPQGISGGGR